jgi:hypothetical protein
MGGNPGCEHSVNGFTVHGHANDAYLRAIAAGWSAYGATAQLRQASTDKAATVNKDRDAIKGHERGTKYPRETLYNGCRLSVALSIPLFSKQKPGNARCSFDQPGMFHCALAHHHVS